MKKIVSDTSPISNLLSINRLDILKNLFGEIAIPQEVAEEVEQISEFGVDTTAFRQAEWISRHEISDKALFEQLRTQLDKGESAAIVLAQELSASLLLVDEKAGRKIAEEMGLKVMGLLGVIAQSKKHGTITEAKPIIDELVQKAGFFVDKTLYQKIMALLGE